ncbi:MAG: hypothetical protein U1E45_15000 [Geminicoccaceae bacterium]
MARYLVAWDLHHDGVVYPPGSVVDLDDEAAARLPQDQLATSPDPVDPPPAEEAKGKKPKATTE